MQQSRGFHFSIKNSPVFVSETGLLFNPPAGSTKTLGKNAPAARRKLAGTYKIGSSYNPGKFTSGTSTVRTNGNYLIYAEASQAVFRRGDYGRDANRGLDLTFGYDWSPADVNLQHTQFTAGARYIGLASKRELDTLAVGFVF